MRLFLLDDDAGAIEAGATVRLDAGETRHLVTVLRAVAGSPVHLADGRGRFLAGELLAVEGGRARIAVRAVRPDPAETRPPRLWLACGVVKGARQEWALEKAVELGAHAVQPLRCERAVVAPGAGRQERWRTIVRAAAKQAGRALVPALLPPRTLAEFLAGLGEAAVYYGEEAARGAPDAAASGAADGAADGAANAAARDGAPGAPVVVAAALALDAVLAGGGLAVERPPPALVWAVGPEGGWSDSERRQLIAAGAVPVRLGPYRLRTETAAAAGLVALQALRERLADARP